MNLYTISVLLYRHSIFQLFINVALNS